MIILKDSTVLHQYDGTGYKIKVCKRVANLLQTFCICNDF
jgi:hypothetical protein